MDELAKKRQRLLEADSLSPQDPNRFEFGGRFFDADEIVSELTEFLTDARRERIEDVLNERTYDVATVVEGLVNMGNVSAVMRSAEALGFQPFHVITGNDRFKNSKRTSQGAEKWLEVYRWPTAEACADYLKGEGYRIVVTHLDEYSIPIDEVEFAEKTALVFGNESEGVSRAMLDLADDRCVIPMSGFVQSFNISVAAAVGLYHARRHRIVKLGQHGNLDESRRRELRAVYYLKSVRHAPRILAERAS